MDHPYLNRTNSYLRRLCVDIPTRLVGTPGNQAATGFIDETMRELGWQTERQRFDSLAYRSGAISLNAGDMHFNAAISPYSLGCDVQADLACASNLEELCSGNFHGKILLLQDELTREQLAPINYVFFNPDTHKEINRLLEKQLPAAVLTATGRNPELAGAQYPFPMIEDGDFNIPTAYLTDLEGTRLAAWAGKPVYLKMDAQRLPSWSENISAFNRSADESRVLVCAHIDSKTGSPGAVDNACGVVVLLLLAEMLQARTPRLAVELLTINGEDNYSAGGELAYLRRHASRLGDIQLAVNIDGAGYRGHPSEISFYECSQATKDSALAELDKYPSLREGPIWYQSDHMVFVMNQIPAIAVTTAAFMDMEREIAHTAKDNLDVVDPQLLMDIAGYLNAFLLRLENSAS